MTLDPNSLPPLRALDEPVTGHIEVEQASWLEVAAWLLGGFAVIAAQFAFFMWLESF